MVDADLQDPPELIPDMAVRRITARMWSTARGGPGRARDSSSDSPPPLFYRAIGRLTDISIPRDTGDFRVMNRRVLDVFPAMPERHRSIRGMVSWAAFRQEPLIYDRHARFAGWTKDPLRKVICFAADAITALSIRPWALAGWLERKT
jgi:polyisoprenyl-phosphate glycosyltransferase